MNFSQLKYIVVIRKNTYGYSFNLWYEISQTKLVSLHECKFYVINTSFLVFSFSSIYSIFLCWYRLQTFWGHILSHTHVRTSYLVSESASSLVSDQQLFEEWIILPWMQKVRIDIFICYLPDLVKSQNTSTLISKSYNTSAISRKIY